jgi:hypothetical protein
MKVISQGFDIKTTNKIRLGAYIFSVLAIVSIFSYKDQISKVIAATISDSDTVDVTAVVPGITPPGGGGGSSGSRQNSVTISGYTFPNAKLTLLRDGQIATTLIANNSGSFTIVVNSLNFGTYQFAVYAEDRDGITSSPYVVNVVVSSNQAYTYSGVVIPPTIQATPTSVQSGQPVAVYGYAPAGSTVFVEVPSSNNFGSTIADSSGFYRYEVRAFLAPGSYYFRSRAQVGAVSSLYSKPVVIQYYAVGQQPPPPPSPYATCVDYNHDHRVNLIDFSILLYWFNKANPPREIDCNGDNRVDIKDFSILMYFWTG